MKFKRLLLILCVFFSVTTAASASLVTLDQALSPLLSGRGAVRFSTALEIKTWLPFDETRIEMLNRVLSRAKLSATLDLDTDQQTTAFQLSLGYTELMAWSEQNQNGAYLLQTSLLPNRMLFSTAASPMDTLIAASDTQEEAQEEITSSLNASDVETAFDMQSALAEIEACYRAVLDQTVPLTEKNSANYAIDDIGKGRISYVARLNTEQSGAMADALRALLSCGMDAEYRAELAQVTFASGLVVALYQNADEEDICVYLKGTMVYPDGGKRSVKWQWAFTPGKETQTYLYEAARESGTRDSRVINAIVETSKDTNAFALEEKTVANLRRSSLSETSTLTVDLQGSAGEPATCKGSVSRKTEAVKSGNTTGKAEAGVTVDLTLQKTADGAELYGTASYSETKNGKTRLELALTFPQSIAAAQSEAPTASGGAPVVISITPADTAAAGQSAQTPTATAEETRAEQSDYLVGLPPLGLFDYTIPDTMITVNMDDAELKIHQSLMGEAAQRLAGNLVTAMLDLPADERELLMDGMTEEDYAVFLAMLD